MNQHTDIIKCPECNKVQEATVEHTHPWYSYVHTCINCGYIIMESEWDSLPKPVHVYPMNDLKAHYLESVDARLDGFSDDVSPTCTCLCNPRKEKREDGVWVIIHNSFDGREGVEIASEILAKKECECDGQCERFVQGGRKCWLDAQ